ncbi:MAG: DUF1349 domain-containing protein [Clostridia bacterium]|nr:DUF1349 domain-containing protein [Clostridia bacterium]
MNENLLRTISDAQTGQFNWLNEAGYEKPDEATLLIHAPGRTDFFTDPAGEHVISNAPFLYLDVSGDFRIKAQVAHAFNSTWDAAVLMVRDSAERWAKLCFEATDFGTQAVVSVVTNGVSDDANGVNYHWKTVWLQVIRKGNLFAFHYGPDGEHWNMVRYFRLDAAKQIKVGMEAQCPGGDGADILFKSFSLDRQPVEDMRDGI